MNTYKRASDMTEDELMDAYNHGTKLQKLFAKEEIARRQTRIVAQYDAERKVREDADKVRKEAEARAARVAAVMKKCGF